MKITGSRVHLTATAKQPIDPRESRHDQITGDCYVVTLTVMAANGEVMTFSPDKWDVEIS